MAEQVSAIVLDEAPQRLSDSFEERPSYAHFQIRTPANRASRAGGVGLGPYMRIYFGPLLPPYHNS